MTTDHISPAGQIFPATNTGRFLVARGQSPAKLNVHASRRGNWQSMVRGLFDNATAKNLLSPLAKPGETLHAPSGETGAIWDIAQQYQSEGASTVIIAGDRYGMGSSRDWAAKGVAMLGVRAVLATSFERIHRSNLINMGVLPIQLPASAHPEVLNLTADDRFEIDVRSPVVRGQVTLGLVRTTGAIELIVATLAIETELEIETLRRGGMIPLILERTLAQVS